MSYILQKHNFGRKCSLLLLISYLFCIVLIPHVIQCSVRKVYSNIGNVLANEDTRRDYLELEETLWQYLDKPYTTKDSRIRKMCEDHQRFIKKHLHVDFPSNKYEILNHYEWSILERDLFQIDGIFGLFRDFLSKHINSIDIDEQAILDICEAALRNDKSFSIPRILENVELIMVNQTMYYRAMVESAEQICQTQQSAQQFLYSLYSDISLAELKGYVMVKFSWMILRNYGRGNYTQESKLMREDYERREERSLKLLREVMRRADRTLWRCDPPQYIKGTNYDEVTRLLQGYIENEVDMNTEETCREDCAFYQSTKSEGCFKSKFCARQQRCTGKLYHCTFVDADMWVCPSALNSTRRYDFIEFENGRKLGKQENFCTRGELKVDSWWRYLFWHCSYCFCLCDEQSHKSDRFFNLRESVSDIKNNKVITGLRFIKKNRIFHLQIQEGELLERGAINISSLKWKPIDEYQIFDDEVRNGRDFHTLSYGNRSIDLDDIETDDNSFVVTGVRFRVIGAHLNLEARFTEFNFTTGELVSIERSTFWKSNDNTDVSGNRRKKIELHNPDIPTRTLVKSIPDSKDNEYIDFVNTSMDKDAAQTTVPFIDVQNVVSNPPTPLAGVGIYHKGRDGFGGFLAPKIITYDFTRHVHSATEVKLQNTYN